MKISRNDPSLAHGAAARRIDDLIRRIQRHNEKMSNRVVSPKPGVMRRERLAQLQPYVLWHIPRRPNGDRASTTDPRQAITYFTYDAYGQLTSGDLAGSPAQGVAPCSWRDRAPRGAVVYRRRCLLPRVLFSSATGCRIMPTRWLHRSWWYRRVRHRRSRRGPC